MNDIRETEVNAASGYVGGDKYVAGRTNKPCHTIIKPIFVARI